MKFWKDPFFYIFWALLFCAYICGVLSNPQLKNGVPQSDVEELINQAYRYGKQTARDDCRRVRDKEEQNETQ